MKLFFLMEFIFWIVFVVAATCIIILIVKTVRSKLRGLSQAAFGVDTITQGLQMQADRLESTPKSVSGMTKIFLPQIERDFPQFNFHEITTKSQNILLTSLRAISERSVQVIPYASDELNRQLKLKVEDCISRDIYERYEGVQVYDTEIAYYEKVQGRCVITLQSAVGYYHYIKQGENITSGSRDRMEQTKYNVKLVYVQDAKTAGIEGTGAGVTCPSCGAPVTNLGAKYCEYCGTGVEEINMRVWLFDSFSEVK